MAWVATKSWVPTDTIADPAAELNRIEGDIHTVYDMLDVYVDLLPAQTYKEDWAASDEISLAQMQNIEDNLQDFCTIYAIPFTARNWAAMVFANSKILNYWESLLDYFHGVALILPTVPLCGTFVCGE